MSKEKQIEGIRKDIFEAFGGYAKWEEEWQSLAEAVYNAGYRKIPENIGEFSDGYHTFNELYHHRAVLFSVICNMFPEKAWKSKLHDTGDMFDGMFIVGIETEQGQATYHYDIEPYWDMFKVKELEKAPKWDGHTPSDAIERIGNRVKQWLYERPSADVAPKSEVAREIFEEINEDCFDQFGYFEYEAYAELKKKYTEGDK